LSETKQGEILTFVKREEAGAAKVLGELWEIRNKNREKQG